MTNYKNDLDLVRRCLLSIYANDINNTIIDNYTQYKGENIVIAQKLKYGHPNGVVYVVDGEYVIETDGELFYYAIDDGGFLEYVAIECVDTIDDWLERQGE